jgi:hypothetical protein
MPPQDGLWIDAPVTLQNGILGDRPGTDKMALTKGNIVCSLLMALLEPCSRFILRIPRFSKAAYGPSGGVLASHCDIKAFAGSGEKRSRCQVTSLSLGE